MKKLWNKKKKNLVNLTLKLIKFSQKCKKIN